MDNRIAATFTPAQRTAIAGAVQTIRDNIPFLMTLSAEDRQELFKAGPKSRGFLELALATAQEHPGMLPASFSTAQFAEDVALFLATERPFVALRDLTRQVADTRIVAGAEAMEAARAVYHYVQGYPGSAPLQEAYEALRVRFQRGPAMPNVQP